MKEHGNTIVVIDQSTSATKAMLFDRYARLLRRMSIPHRQYYPADGFVEHDAMEIFDNVCQVLMQIASEKVADEAGIAALAITNQRETALIWDRCTGLPVARAAVWQCGRGEPFCLEITRKGFADSIRKKTGLRVDPYYSASKLHWLMHHVDGLQGKAERGELMLGTIDSWLIYKLTGGRVHATDYTNACRTMLFNIHTLQWDPELIDLFGLHPSMFQEIKSSNDIFGFTDPGIVGSHPVPITGVIGDSHGALFGQRCFLPGMAKSTYGTGSSIMMNIGFQPLEAPEGLVTSIGYALAGKISYVFEGNIHCTGDTLNWLKNEVGLIADPAETEILATSVENNNGVYLVPAFVGLGAPWWDPGARACLSGMARNTTKAHIARAALESIAYQIKDLVALMEEEGGIPLRELRVDGGATRNNFLMQFQANLLDLKVVRPDIEEISALGAALIAGLTAGFWKNPDEPAIKTSSGFAFYPKNNSGKSQEWYAGWKKAVERARLK